MRILTYVLLLFAACNHPVKQKDNSLTKQKTINIIRVKDSKVKSSKVVVDDTKDNICIVSGKIKFDPIYSGAPCFENELTFSVKKKK